MHKKFDDWRQAMKDLEQASRENVGPELRADAVRRAGETHEAVLRQMAIEIDRLRRAISANVDRTQSAISEESITLAERIDDLAARLHQAEIAIHTLQAIIGRLRAAIEGDANVIGGPEGE